MYWRLSAVPDPESEESGMKYFILGAFASAFFVYGAALIFGATGTTNLPAIFERSHSVVATGRIVTFLLLIGAGLDSGRPGLQSRGCALPYVDAGCL